MTTDQPPEIEFSPGRAVGEQRYALVRLGNVERKRVGDLLIVAQGQASSEDEIRFWKRISDRLLSDLDDL